MKDQLDDRFKMFLKVSDFLKTFDTTLSGNPAIVTLYNELKALIADITDQDGTATENSEGYTDQRDASRIELVAATVKVSSALFAYWLNAGAANELNPADYKERELKRRPDGNLFLRATKLHELADPVKALLAPYNCTAADVDALAVKKKNFFDDVEAPKKAQKNKSDAHKKVIQLMKDGTAILKKLDVYLATFNSGSDANRSMYMEYKMARKVDKSGGPKKKKKQKPDPQGKLFADN